MPAAGLLTGIYSAAGDRSLPQSAKSAKSGPRGPPTMAFFSNIPVVKLPDTLQLAASAEVG
jgi:hypothetical protein